MADIEHRSRDPSALPKDVVTFNSQSQQCIFQVRAPFPTVEGVTLANMEQLSSQLQEVVPFEGRQAQKGRFQPSIEQIEEVEDFLNSAFTTADLVVFVVRLLHKKDSVQLQVLLTHQQIAQKRTHKEYLALLLKETNNLCVFQSHDETRRSDFNRMCPPCVAKSLRCWLFLLVQVHYACIDWQRISSQCFEAVIL